MHVASSAAWSAAEFDGGRLRCDMFNIVLLPIFRTAVAPYKNVLTRFCTVSFLWNCNEDFEDETAAGGLPSS
jgi:hypothetical protein